MLLFPPPSRPDSPSYHGTESNGQKRRACTQECTQVSPPAWRDPVSHNLLQGNGRLVGFLRSIILYVWCSSYIVSGTRDIWDHMFLSGHFQSLTQHIFQTPPMLTLDIGCGSGFWAIEAAKQWQVCLSIQCSFEWHVYLIYCAHRNLK